MMWRDVWVDFLRRLFHVFGGLVVFRLAFWLVLFSLICDAVSRHIMVMDPWRSMMTISKKITCF